jgi:hypothetical protein
MSAELMSAELLRSADHDGRLKNTLIVIGVSTIVNVTAEPSLGGAKQNW